MKALMVIGAIAGFLIGLLSGLAGETAWPLVFWRACVAALVLAVLMRWWASIWFGSLRQAVEQQLAAARKKETKT